MLPNQNRIRNSRWAAALLVGVLGLGTAAGCAWIRGSEGQPAAQASRASAPARDALPVASAPPRRSALRDYERRDPFSRLLARRYRAAAAAAAAEVGALAVQQPAMARELARVAGPSQKAQALRPSQAAPLPAVGAGPPDRDARSRRALWIAMVMVVGMGLTGMWLARRQTRI